VVDSCLTIAANEGINDPEELTILETAAWLHDVGFVRSYFEHEVQSCIIAKEILPEAGATQQEIEKVCELIMATKIPQSPKCHLSQIICDADLDYLGRDDFYIWSAKLKQEWLNYAIIKDEDDFFARQLKFLNAHQYHTSDAQKRREPMKQERLQELLKSNPIPIRISA
jgi:predicted metal-dependent HD superfamily phosphohydrolase